MGPSARIWKEASVWLSAAVASLLSMERMGGVGGVGPWESWCLTGSVQGCTGFMASHGFSTGSAEVGATLAVAWERDCG